MTKSITRKRMKFSDLALTKAKLVAQFSTLDGKIYEPNTNQVPVFDTNSPGFYFFVPLEAGNTDPDIHARFFVGRQRSSCGLRDIASQLKRQRTMTGKKIIASKLQFDVYYVSIENAKPITTGYPKKSKVALAFTRKHSGNYQNLEELNRIISDHFEFVAQRY